MFGRSLCSCDPLQGLTQLFSIHVSPGGPKDPEFQSGTLEPGTLDSGTLNHGTWNSNRLVPSGESAAVAAEDVGSVCVL